MAIGLQKVMIEIFLGAYRSESHSSECDLLEHTKEVRHTEREVRQYQLIISGDKSVGNAQNRSFICDEISKPRLTLDGNMNGLAHPACHLVAEPVSYILLSLDIEPGVRNRVEWDYGKDHNCKLTPLEFLIDP